MGPTPQEQKALEELWWYVRRQGGVLTSGRLTGFCQKFPAHRGRNFKQLCKSCPDFNVADQVDGQWTIRLVWAEEDDVKFSFFGSQSATLHPPPAQSHKKQEAVRDLAAFIRSLGRPLRSKEFPDFQSSHQAAQVSERRAWG